MLIFLPQSIIRLLEIVSVALHSRNTGLGPYFIIYKDLSVESVSSVLEIGFPISVLTDRLKYPFSIELVT